jgi:hypothetical protein
MRWQVVWGERKGTYGSPDMEQTSTRLSRNAFFSDGVISISLCTSRHRGGDLQNMHLVRVVCENKGVDDRESEGMSSWELSKKFVKLLWISTMQVARGEETYRRYCPRSRKFQSP